MSPNGGLHSQSINVQVAAQSARNGFNFTPTRNLENPSDNGGIGLSVTQSEQKFQAPLTLPFVKE